MIRKFTEERVFDFDNVYRSYNLTRQPNWSPPITVSSKQVCVTFSRHVLHIIALSFNL